MTCCNGNCTQGRDCPTRQQRLKEVNNLYIQNGLHDDPIDDFADTFKGLLVVMTAALAVWIVLLLLWGKL